MIILIMVLLLGWLCAQYRPAAVVPTSRVPIRNADRPWSSLLMGARLGGCDFEVRMHQILPAKRPRLRHAEASHHRAAVRRLTDVDGATNPSKYLVVLLAQTQTVTRQPATRHERSAPGSLMPGRGSGYRAEWQPLTRSVPVGLCLLHRDEDAGRDESPVGDAAAALAA